ncbi:Uncharacterised protein [Burkholderia pseudomallei]|nr:Uncharacterised protein [Burkholderia pseudomallei]CAJ8380779.1 Uncharacterised protein [Burkholderia pseudomallei]CAK1332875.1 Uncharacterised protein [Burkholderia pseudomallei]CPH46656.1 Uncharacterised protein [Burkholderia pseudomallei]CPH57922.1 Uncharacterised protein [Burkholderia pseudomallei]
MSGKVILWRSAGARRADIRRICLTKPQADIAGEMRDARASCKLQTANCKLQTGSLDVLRSSAVEARVNWATQSFQTRQPSRIFELRVFEPSRLPVFPSSRLPVFTSSRLHVFTSSRLHVFTSSRLHVFEISRHRNFPPLEPFSNHSSDSTRPPIRPFAHSLIRSFAHSLTSPTLPLLRLSPSLVRARPTRVGRLASPHRVTPSGASAPKPLRHATPHARLSRARGRRRDCARPPSPDRAPDRPPRRSRRYAARTRRPDATPRRRR